MKKRLSKTAKSTMPKQMMVNRARLSRLTTVLIEASVSGSGLFNRI
jgi:hypothetical protein